MVVCRPHHHWKQHRGIHLKEAYVGKCFIKPNGEIGESSCFLDLNHKLVYHAINDDSTGTQTRIFKFLRLKSSLNRTAKRNSLSC